MISKRKMVAAAGLLLAMAATLWWWPKGEGEQGRGRPPRQAVVQLATVGVNRQPLLLQAAGTVTALDRVDLKPQVAGVVSRVWVRDGDTVRAGALLVQLDDAAERAQLARLQAQLAGDRAQLAGAQRELARSRELLQQQFIAQSALDAVETRVETQQAAVAATVAQLAVAQVAIQQKQLRAPLDGRVGEVALSPGSQVQPGMAAAMLTITRLQPVAVSFGLSERELVAVRQAQARSPLPVLVRPDGGRQCVRGVLRFIDSTVDRVSGQVLLKAHVDNAAQALWPGQFVSVTLAAGQLPGAVVLPVAGLLSGPDGQFAYAVGADSKARRVPLTVLAIQQEQAIVRGIAAGERVIVAGGHDVRPGEVVTVAARGGRQTASAPAAARVGRKAASAAVAEGGDACAAAPPAAGRQRLASGAQ